MKVLKEIEVKIKDDEILKIFLERVCLDFLVELQRCAKDLGENPMGYRERTKSSFLFPALQNNSVRTLMEVYYNNGARNFVDFYSLDKTRECSYLIEFKHCFFGTKQEKLGENEKNKWEEVNKQIAKLTKEEVNEYIDSKKTIYGISFYVLTVADKKDKANEEIEDKVIKNIEKEMKDFDWGWIEELPEELYYDESDEEEDRYSHIVLLGKIRTIEKPIKK